jgi:hypothetical protein
MASAILPFLPAIIGAASSGLGALFGGNKETPMQGKQAELIDQLLSSLGGSGPFSDLFSTDEVAFQKSFVDPAKSLFSNQIAPQIQQEFIASGQQRGTGLEDTLTRAGVDLDQMLNSQFMNFQQQGQNRQLGAIDRILSQGAGAPAEQGGFEKFLGGLGGFGTSESLPRLLEQLTDRRPQQRAGFTS